MRTAIEFVGDPVTPTDLRMMSPLRAVVGFVNVEIVGPITGEVTVVQRELLECGHVVRIKRDIFGETNASRRRCRKCKGDRADDQGKSSAPARRMN